MKTHAIIQSLEFIDQDYREALLDQLRNKVFHVTSSSGYESISADGFIFNNKDGIYEINTGSAKSYGRNNGWVCLFDLRAKSEKEINDALDRYYFLSPTWFAVYSPDCIEWNIVYLLLNPNCYQHLIPNEEARKVWDTPSLNTQYVPKVECWYPGNLPIDSIQRILQIKIRRSAPKDNPFMYAHHMLALEEQRKTALSNSQGGRFSPREIGDLS